MHGKRDVFLINILQSSVWPWWKAMVESHSKSPVLHMTELSENKKIGTSIF